MANTFTNLQRALIEDTVLPALKAALIPIESCSLKLMDRPMAKGETVAVPIASAASAGTYSTTYESGNTTTTGTVVTMLAPEFSSWHFDPQLDQVLMTPELWLSKAREAAYAVAKGVLGDVLALYLSANIGDVADTDKKVVTAANYDARSQAPLWGMLKTKGVTGPVSAIHTINYAANLLEDAALLDRSASGSDVLQTGELPSILGARQFYTDAFPAAITNQYTGVIYTSKETVALAMTVPQAIDEGLVSGSGVRTEVLRDPDTGLSLLYREWFNSATGVFWGTVAAMYGLSFNRNAAVRIVSQ
jgi:hypothetical protein